MNTDIYAEFTKAADLIASRREFADVDASERLNAVVNIAQLAVVHAACQKIKSSGEETMSVR